LTHGDATGALAAYRKSLGIRQRLATQEPTNAVWQRDLAVLYYRLASICCHSGDSEREHEWMHECHQTLSRMRESGMHLDPPIANLLNQLDDTFGT